MPQDWEYAELICSAEIEKDTPHDGVWFLDLTLRCLAVASALGAVYLVALLILSLVGPR